MNNYDTNYGNYGQKPEEMNRILLVEDDPNFGTVLKDYLVMSGFDVALAKNGMEGFDRFRKEEFDMCILDVKFVRRTRKYLSFSLLLVQCVRM